MTAVSSQSHGNGSRDTTQPKVLAQPPNTPDPNYSDCLLYATGHGIHCKHPTLDTKEFSQRSCVHEQKGQRSFGHMKE